MKHARLLVHTESFKKKDKVLIENAFSTKIPDSLASGVLFFIYGPEHAGFAPYFAKHSDAVYFTTDRNKLDEELKEALLNQKSRKSKVLKALELAKEEHNREKNSKRIKEELTNI